MNNDIELLQSIEKRLNITFGNFEDFRSKEKSRNSSGSGIRKTENLAELQLAKYDKDGNVIEIYLNGLKLDLVPHEIFQLRNLRRFDFVHNSLAHIPLDFNTLPKLSTLFLFNNNISTIPTEILFKKSLKKFNINDNPLDIPEEVVSKGINHIRDYVLSLNGETKNLNEIKVILVGDGGSGKTSLQKLLTNQKFNPQELQTHGINIKHLQLRPDGQLVTYRLWDFGGQEIMHATHQFFLSRRSIYIILLNAREETNPEYWLNHVKSFGGDSPVLIIINKVDENPSYDVNRLFLKEKYPNIIDIVKVSCSKKQGIEEVKNHLRNAVKDIGNLNVKWAISWFGVKKKLESMSTNFISYDEFAEICEENGVYNKSSQNTLVEYLNDLGIILHFKDFHLMDTHVLDPEWVTFAVYKILNSSTLAKNKGLLNLSSIRSILSQSKEEGKFRYPSSQLNYIIELMIKFELCYKITQNEILVPDLLAVQEPNFNFENNNDILNIIVSYDFLPKSVIARLIVNLHLDIVDNLMWRTGVILSDVNLKSTAIIKCDYEKKEIHISINGERKRDYLAVILFHIARINKSFDNVVYKINLPLNLDGSVKVSHSHLLTLESKGISSFIPEGLDYEVDVQQLLGSIKSNRNLEEEIFALLDTLVSKADKQETILEKANDIIQLQPNIMGFGININSLVKKYIKKKNN